MLCRSLKEEFLCHVTGNMVTWNFFFWLCHMAHGILAPRTGIEPTCPALEACSLNHWTAREVPTWDLMLSEGEGKEMKAFRK